jgi:hypothetical protein
VDADEFARDVIRFVAAVADSVVVRLAVVAKHFFTVEPMNRVQNLVDDDVVGKQKTDKSHSTCIGSAWMRDLQYQLKFSTPTWLNRYKTDSFNLKSGFGFRLET